MPNDFPMMIHNMVEKYLESEKLRRSIFEKPQVAKNIARNPPPQGWICVNVEGTTDEPSKVACGEIIMGLSAEDSPNILELATLKQLNLGGS